MHWTRNMHVIIRVKLGLVINIATSQVLWMHHWGLEAKKVSCSISFALCSQVV